MSIIKGKSDEYLSVYTDRDYHWSSKRQGRFKVTIESTTVNTVVQAISIIADSKADALRIAEERDPECKSITDVEFISDTVKYTVEEKYLSIKEE